MNNELDMTDPLVAKYYEALCNRTIIFNQEVDADMFELFAYPLMEFDSDGTGKPITILLSSNGGSALDGLYICNIIENLKTPTTIKLMGYVYSMGFLMAMAGSLNDNVTVECFEFTTGLLHIGSLTVAGETSSVMDFMEFNSKLNKQIQEYVIRHTTLTKEDYEALERKDKYYTASEMYDLGIITKILKYEGGQD